jgi:hypothetical protein
MSTRQEGQSVASRGERTAFIAVVGVLAATFMAAAVVGGTSRVMAASEDENGDGGAYAIGLWGDVPYSPLQDTVGVPNLIADMNAQRLAFTVNDGDLKAGSSRCDNAVYARALEFFDSLEAPAMFTPGDNDWTDCDRPSAGAYSSRERLDYERQLFFSTPLSMGRSKLRQSVQATPLCLGVSGPVPCVENRRWMFERVVYATLNIQGSCNNLCDTAPDPDEYAARNQADIVWMREAFAVAKQRQGAAVMLIAQADSGWDETGARNPRTLAQTDGLPDGFQTFLLALREEVVTFRRPVVYVHGDSHYFRVDKPFQDALGRRLENFTRLETFGDNQANGNNDVQWVKVTVDPRTREVFSFQPQIVPGNRTAVPAP